MPCRWYRGGSIRSSPSICGVILHPILEQSTTETESIVCLNILLEPEQVANKVVLIVALTRFKRILPRARLEVRLLTHTLHFPPARPEFYDGPHAEWLRDILEQLPNLQSLVVSQLPFFDHPSLVALKHHSALRASKETDDFPTFPLRLLIATRCDNTTSSGLGEALLHWPNLVFLDLSFTLAARDEAVYASLRYMTALQVLKLRHIGLRDCDFDVLGPCIGSKVRSLDLRDNKLTDASVRTLLTYCVHLHRDVHSRHQNEAERSLNETESWPSGVPRPNRHLLNEFKGDDMDEKFVRRLTQSVAGRLPSEDLPRPGLTHLYITNNLVTVEGMASLIKTENLHVLDAGSVDAAKAFGRPRSGSLATNPLDFALPGAEKLTALLETFGSKNVTHLRLHHALVTKPAVNLKDNPLATLELDGVEQRPEIDGVGPARHELESHTHVLEMDSTVPIYELSAERFDDPPDFPVESIPPIIISPVTDDVSSPDTDGPETPTTSREMRISVDHEYKVDNPLVVTPTGLGNIAQAINGIGVPDRVIETRDDGDGEPLFVLSATGGLGYIAQAMNGVSQGNIQNIDPSTASKPPPSPTITVTEEPEKNIDGVVNNIKRQRNDLRTSLRDPSRGLLPGLLPAMRTLILTEVPTHVISKSIIANLRNFISDCAREHHLATSQAALEHPHLYIPGKPRSSHQLHRARELFALQTIVLEMAPVSIPTVPLKQFGPTSTNNPFAVPPRTPPNGWGFHQRNRSSTGDPDTEAFWSAQENDFSFFGEEECGLPASEPGMHIPLSLLEEKIVTPIDYPMGSPNSPNVQSFAAAMARNQLQQQNMEGVFDVVKELAAWRADRKRAFLERKEMFRGSSGDGYVEGYWPGEVKVIRPDAVRRSIGEVDWYGNYFERGVYR